MNTCKYCNNEYSRSETIRIFGDMWWTGIYCSAQCMTKALMEKEARENDDQKKSNN
jgi:hypothetical protein